MIGKFDSTLDAQLYGLSLDGCAETCGNVDAYGMHFTLLRGPFDDAELTEDDRVTLATTTAVIISENSQGFVSVEYLTAEDDVDAVWALHEQLLADEESR